jgi:hypothetical protein
MKLRIEGETKVETDDHFQKYYIISYHIILYYIIYLSILVDIMNALVECNRIRLVLLSLGFFSSN